MARCELPARVRRAPTAETRSWLAGFAIADRQGYSEVRDCRIFALAYSMGFANGKRAVLRAAGKKRGKR